MAARDIDNLIEKYKSTMIDWRRHLHKFPELSYQEHETARFVYRTLEKLENIELSRPTPTSVMARLHGCEPGRVLVIRADTDALPVQEENDLEYASRKPGIMHACGHDGHIAMLMATAEVLASLRDQIKGEVRFIFQHAEEKYPGGAEELVQAGVMEKADWVIGAHLWASLKVGTIGIGYGSIMASPDGFRITIKGRGGHAALPHQTNDPIAIGAQIVTNLQHIVARNIDPLENVVVSVTQFKAGNTDNIISGSAELSGTVRTFDPKIRRKISQLIERIAKGITEAHGATCIYNYYEGYRTVINSQEVTKVIADTVKEVLGEEALIFVRPSMGGEDFSAYLQKTPGTFFFVGAGNKEKGLSYPHHHPRFNIDEEGMINGVRIFVHTTLKLLG
ncbi:MAG: amidohydrolase [Desulfitobacteriaceae bacterium]|nr:amidohydrolase [Desulfitobacteriaceae bacterium]MDD4345445.1 amidohydrolase [Desulfitobacteriaceae bacterium]MDD4400708.1 amidohydrolase [Desulfitobacteriaceae bacterium]